MVLLAEPSDFPGAKLRSCDGHFYAFTTIWILMAAVQSLVALREYGFHLTEYESNESIVLPDGQVAFRKEKAKLIGSFPIHEFPFENYYEEGI